MKPYSYRFALTWLGGALILLVLTLATPVKTALADISLRAAATGGNPYSNLSSLTIPVPAGVQPGDVLIAQIATRLYPDVPLAAPAGWTLVRRDQSLGQQQVANAIYYRVVPGGGETASIYSWSFPPGPHNAVGGIAAYSGVNPVDPIDASSGQGDSDAGASTIEAPSLEVPAGHYGDLLLCVYTVANGSPIELPPGLQQRWGLHPPSFGIYEAMGEVQLTSATATPNEIALATTPRPNVGQQIALRAIAVSAWPMTAHDVQRTGQSPVDTSADSGNLKWRLALDGGAFLPAALAADGTIYLGRQLDGLYAFAPNGSKKWQFDGLCFVCSPEGNPEGTPDGFSAPPMVGPDGTIYVGSLGGTLYALSPGGLEKWGFHNFDGGSVLSSALGADGTVYVGATFLYALNPNGTQKWEFTGDNGLNSLAVGTDGTIYAGSSNSYLLAIAPNGTEKWRFATDNAVEASPAIGGDGTIYVGSFGGILYAIARDGIEKWRFTTGGLLASSPAIGADSTIYFGSYDKHLYALNPDGTEKWGFSTDGPIRSSPAIGADGTVYVGSYGKRNLVSDATFYAITTGGAAKWQFTTDGGIGSSAAIGSDATIYISTENSRTYAIH